MTKQLADFVAPTMLHVSDAGELHVFISDMFSPDIEDSTAALNWACAVVNNEEEEHSLALTVNFPKTLDRVFDLYRLTAYKDHIVFDVENKPIIDALRTQFQTALDALVKVRFADSRVDPATPHESE